MYSLFILLYRIVFVMYYILLYCIVLYCIVLYCIVLYCMVLYCIFILLNYNWPIEVGLPQCCGDGGGGGCGGGGELLDKIWGGWLGEGWVERGLNMRLERKNTPTTPPPQSSQ